jgi:hypothetical protein
LFETFGVRGPPLAFVELFPKGLFRGLQAIYRVGMDVEI